MTRLLCTVGIAIWAAAPCAQVLETDPLVADPSVSRIVAVVAEAPIVPGAKDDVRGDLPAEADTLAAVVAAWDPAKAPGGVFGLPSGAFADSTLSPLDTLDMSLWERTFWGRHGLARVTGLFPTHPDEPTDDLRQIAAVRRRMLGLHQTLGLATVASMAATVVGGQIAVSTGNSGFHEATLPVTIGLYSTTAALALLSPPKIVSFDGGGIDSITLHRWLAAGHVAGMILTPLLAPDGADDARVHQISGYATFGTLTAAMLVVTLLRR